MTKQETIEMLKSIEDRATDFPYMTACDWVAIAAAKRHLTEEPVSEDLEEEIEQYCLRHGYINSFKDCGYTFNEQVGDIARHFANWQKQQMMKDAVDGNITSAGSENNYNVAAFRFDEIHTFTVLLPVDENAKYGDKVKLIIIKED